MKEEVRDIGARQELDGGRKNSSVGFVFLCQGGHCSDCCGWHVVQIVVVAGRLENTEASEDQTKTYSIKTNCTVLDIRREILGLSRAA